MISNLENGNLRLSKLQVQKSFSFPSETVLWGTVTSISRFLVFVPVGITFLFLLNLAFLVLFKPDKGSEWLGLLKLSNHRNPKNLLMLWELLVFLFFFCVLHRQVLAMVAMLLWSAPRYVWRWNAVPLISPIISGDWLLSHRKWQSIWVAILIFFVFGEWILSGACLWIRFSNQAWL